MEFGPDRCWVEGRNPYLLSKPSPWWLQLLHDYDAELVVMPSVKDYGYRLCRRVQVQNRQGLGPLATIQGHPDTIQMALYGLVPISTLAPWALRSDKVIRDLMRRDTRRHARGGDPNSVVDDIEYNETLANRRAERLYQDAMDVVSGEAFRSLQFQNGSAISMRGRAPQHSSRMERTRLVSRPFDKPRTKSVISSPSSSPGPALVAPRLTIP